MIIDMVDGKVTATAETLKEIETLVSLGGTVRTAGCVRKATRCGLCGLRFKGLRGIGQHRAWVHDGTKRKGKAKVGNAKTTE